MDALSVDHPCGPRPWTPARGHGSSTIPVDLVHGPPARGPGSWTTPVDLVHGPPLVDPVHGILLWTTPNV